MYRPRVIPVLLLKKMGLVKSVKFKNHRYIGDPINAVKIFNDLNADELSFLDITASHEKRCISVEFVKKVGDEANMPFSVGGGINKIQIIRDILKAGAEKVIINTHAVLYPEFIREASNEFGSSTIVVSIDVKKRMFGQKTISIFGGKKRTDKNPVDFAKLMEELGAGELIINSIDHDGCMAGYDFDLIKDVSDSVTIPVVSLGGAGNVAHMRESVKIGHASAVAAGSMFVYHGRRKAVLINYPKQEELSVLFKDIYD